MPMTSSASVSLTVATNAGSKAKATPRRLRLGLRGARHRDDDFLAFFNVACGDLGRCAVGDSEPESDRRRLLASPDVNGAFAATPAAALALTTSAIAAIAAAPAGGVRALGVVLPFGRRLRLRFVL